LAESAVIAGDGGGGKDEALTLALAALNGATLPGGIRSARRITAALILDYETTKETVDELTYLLCRAHGWSAAGLHYKAMTAALVSQIAAVKSDVARLGVEFGIDPEGANAAVSFHTRAPEPRPQCYSARDRARERPGRAQTRGAARPFGSVFNMNLPRSVLGIAPSNEDADGDLQVARVSQEEQPRQAPPADRPGLRLRA
jgi:hypothetical protein